VDSVKSLLPLFSLGLIDGEGWDGGGEAADHVIMSATTTIHTLLVWEVMTTSTVHTLSQKQFGKYLSLEIFPARMGIESVLFEKISCSGHQEPEYSRGRRC
jgi:hypothetical protein